MSSAITHLGAMPVSKIRAVLFDLDGVLVQSEPLKARAHAETVNRLGGRVSTALYVKLMGQPHEAVRAAFLAAGGIDADPECYTRTYRRIYRKLLQTELETTPGIVAVVRHLAGKGYSLAVVSSSPAATVTQILDQTGLSSFFPVRVAADDVEKSKPAPDPYVRALDLLFVPPTSAVAIEDSEAGVASASASGMRVLALRHSYNACQDLSRAYAVLSESVDTQTVVQMIDSLLDP